MVVQWREQDKSHQNVILRLTDLELLFSLSKSPFFHEKAIANRKLRIREIMWWASTKLDKTSNDNCNQSCQFGIGKYVLHKSGPFDIPAIDESKNAWNKKRDIETKIKLEMNEFIGTYRTVTNFSFWMNFRFSTYLKVAFFQRVRCIFQISK